MEQVPEANRATNIFIAHGKKDRTIPVLLSRKTKRTLQAKGEAQKFATIISAWSRILCQCPTILTIPSYAGMRNVEYKVYDGVAHEISSQGLDDIRDFLLRMLPPKAATM